MKKLLQSLFILLLLAGTAMAQDRTITGTVTDKADGSPLPGVTVKIIGAQGGTQTGANGQYSINVPSSATSLEFSYLGYLPQTLTISGGVIDVSLENDVKALTEVVVVGYGTTTKQAFTGTAKVVSSAQLDKKRVSSIGQALAGEVSGLRVINTSGQPGTEATIRVRGFGSVNGNRNPLYVVDGVPFTGSISSINVADIESTTILKDAAATAIYGSRGANGVIIVTTKSGKGKVPYIEVDGQLGTNMSLLPRYDVIKSPEDYIGLSWESLYNEEMFYGNGDPTAYANENLFTGVDVGGSGIASQYNLWNVADGGELIDPVTRKVRAGVTRKFDPESWEDAAFQSSVRQEVNVKIGGGDTKSNYYTSLGYLNDKGYSVSSDYKRLTGRLNLNHQVKPWLTGSMNIGYARSETHRGGQSEDSGSIFWFVDNIPPIYPLFLRDANGDKIPDPIFGGFQYDYGDAGRGFGGLTNAIADAKYDTQRDNRNELNGSTSLDFKIIDGLTFENRLGVQYYNNIYVNRGNKYYGSSASQNGSIFNTRTELFSYNLLDLLRYKKDFGDHNFEVLAAHESTDWRLNSLSVSAYNLVDDQLEDFNNAVVSNPTDSYTNRYKLDSYFSQVNYDYKGTYFLSGSLRRDGSSRFVKNKWGTFGSVGGAWLISNEQFMESQSIFSSLKLKASYGLIGEQEGIGYYPGYDLFGVDNLNDNPAFSFSTKGNPDLTWETSKMFQAGVEFNLGTYLTGAFDYYQKNTKDLIFDRRLGPSIGYALIRVNDGNLKNQGFEFDLTGHILKSNDFYVDLGINGEILKNEITKMPLDPVTGMEKPIDVQTNYGWAKGHSIYDFYMRQFTGVDPEDGTSTWDSYWVDRNGDGVADDGVYETTPDGEHVSDLEAFKANNPELVSQLQHGTTKTYSDATQQFNGKSAVPKVRGAFNLSAGYKGFDLSVQFLYSLGGYAYDAAYATLMGNDHVGTNNWHTDMFNRWQNEGDITDVPRLSNEADANVNSRSSRFLIKADYLALNNVRLGYNVPEKYLSKLGVAGLSIWVSGDNLWINSARKGFNPSTDEAGLSDIYRYSPLSTISAGLRARF